MRPRRDQIVLGRQVTTVDLAADTPLDIAKSESKADVRAMMWRKVRAISPAADEIDRLLLIMLRFVVLADKRTTLGLTSAETAFMSAARAALARIWALRQAADEIETEIDGLATVATVFDHNENLAANPIWPE